MTSPKHDTGPGLSGNPAAGNPDNFESEDIPAEPIDETQDDDESAVTKLPRTPPAPD